ncbi:MAG: 6-phospho-beta-glucosidase [Armatimonadota bacterium]|nr:6-phospho-beta-glucosidase [Armatimonadota bacterium]MDR7548768.1 6-phospho-beta-glucosidase [Armatimonadota bacterium]
MILSVIGGGGMRTPLLVGGLIERRARVPVEQVILHDVDADALAVVGALADALLARSGRPFAVRTTTSLDEALEGPSFVVTSIRVGGLAGRTVDEQVPLAFGVVGQETTGPGGWAMALRTIPVLTGIAARLRRRASAAWLINFTNPAGLVTQALTASGEARVIGICDAPPALGRRIADRLGVPEDALRLDYLGLDHLGWVRAVWVDGIDRLPDILASDDAIRTVYGRPLFEPAEIRRLGLLPNEYLHYYYHHQEVVRRLRAAPKTRGQAVADVASQLREAVLQAAARGEDPLPHYEAAVFARRSSYMATETGQARDLAMMGGRVEGGYARAALGVIEAMVTPSRHELIVNTTNGRAIDDLAADDVVEVPCRVDTGGVRPRRMGRLPAQVRDLVLQVKAYERATVEAALEGSWAGAVAALARHPLVPSAEVARRMAEEFRRRLAPHLDYLR